MGQVTNQEALEDQLNRVIDQIGRNNIRLIFPQYKKVDYLQDVVSRFSTLLWRESQDGTNWENAARRVKGENAIPIMTVHKSKGLEYHTVIFIGLEDSAFWNYKEKPEEEISTFFVAMSRAIKRLVFTFSDLRNARQNTRNNIKGLYDLLKNSGVVIETDCR
ncbi:MAG: 3'-5' exonuclease [Anaerolineaceae bacterium]|jgi:DNA helicase-2/ATP-dependent DNA helicase PcrA|nr:3'-5' exonuclease [Anaerolineaceae bacterium]